MPLIATTGTAAAESNGYEIALPRDRYFPESTLLIAGNTGTNNITFLDSSTANSGSGWSVTRGGTATQGSYNPFARGPLDWGWFLYNTANFTFPAGLVTAMGTTGLAGKRFTMECFIYPNNISTANAGRTGIFGTYDGVAANGRFWFGFVATSGTTARLCFTYTTSTSSEVNAVASAATILTNQWNHIAVTIDATVATSATINFFVNGVFVSSSTGNNFSTQTTYYTTPFLGTSLSGGVNNAYQGYVSNFRLSYDAIMYTGNYTVPTSALPVDSSTILLTCQNNYAKDNSTNNFTVTSDAGPAPSVISPFTYNSPYVPATSGGAMYFGNNTDYVVVPDNAALEIGTSTFCFECFFYLNATGSTYTILQKRIGTTVAPIIVWVSGNAVQVYLASTTQGDMVNGTSLGTVTAKQWYHVAVYRTAANFLVGSLNGVITIMGGNAASILNNSVGYYIGMNGNGTSDPFNGVITNARLVIGSSIYTTTSAPIPTRPLANITNTKFLLLGANAGIFDSTANFHMKLVNATGFSTPSKYGVGSLLFNGTNAYVQLLPYNANFSSLITPMGDITVEAFINPSAFTALQTVFFFSGAGSGFAAIRLDIAATTRIPTAYSTVDGIAWTATLTSSTALPTTGWSHVAIVRNGGTFTFYINGTSVATSTSIAVTSPLLVGAISYLGTPNSTGFFYSGSIYGLRISNAARYTTTFTPPTGPYPLLGP